MEESKPQFSSAEKGKKEPEINQSELGNAQEVMEDRKIEQKSREQLEKSQNEQEEQIDKEREEVQKQRQIEAVDVSQREGYERERKPKKQEEIDCQEQKMKAKSLQQVTEYKEREESEMRLSHKVKDIIENEPSKSAQSEEENQNADKHCSMILKNTAFSEKTTKTLSVGMERNDIQVGVMEKDMNEESIVDQIASLFIPVCNQPNNVTPKNIDMKKMKEDEKDKEKRAKRSLSMNSFDRDETQKELEKKSKKKEAREKSSQSEVKEKKTKFRLSSSFALKLSKLGSSDDLHRVSPSLPSPTLPSPSKKSPKFSLGFKKSK
eukprot:TRINITY_DN4626_c0_g1_i1.p1 TRINITY_DN4626_c0_g1~~TRINITY_DN4626_c0_g1_i1.p1  ORF type:complete len:358 (+),score=120.40 TRINITY_DN4626_c0_g1_i1:112-1074(+)